MFKVIASSAFLILTVFVVGLYDLHPEYKTIFGNPIRVATRDRMQTIVKRSVRIEYVCGLEHKGLKGSGVVIGKSKDTTTVVTADHVINLIADCDIVVRDWRGLSGYGKVVKSDKASDIAVIEVGEPLGEVAPLYRSAYLGQEIACVGWPMIPYSPDVDQLSITRGYVSTKVGRYLRVSADIFYGNSGGACFSKRGHVVGIVSFFFGSDADGFFDLATPRPGQFYISDVKNLKILLD